MSERLVHLDLPGLVPERRVALSSVSVRDISVAADIGIHPHEIGSAQPLIAAVTLMIRAPRVDRIEDTIDYNVIVALVERLAKTRTGLIETFARLLATACLDLPGVTSADDTVEKPEALGNGVASTRVVMEVGSVSLSR